MKYALGNMLNGAGSLNPDGLSLDLQFATDKTLAARKGPTPVFTRASTATFVGSDGLIQSAAINAARFDHDPVTLACKGLLIEESRTNLVLQSEDFSTTWSAISATVSVNATTSPNGLVTADKLIVNLLSVTGRLSQNTTLTGSHTFSAFLKASEWSWAFITPSAAVGGVWFNLSNGTIGTQQSGCVGSIVSYGNGWYRCSVTLTGTGVASTARVTPTNADNANTAGDGTSGIFAWGAQLEAGSFPTSYIPTVASTVVRSADVCSITGSDFSGFYNQSEGTVYTESRPATVNGTTTTFGLSNGTSNERWLNRFAQNEQVTVTSAGTESGFDALNPVAGTLYKAATAGKLNDFAMSINGLAVVTDTNQPMPVVDRAGIGNPTGSVAGGGAVTIAAIRYYRKRLPNAKLTQLTT
jgi:hypothetical protein